MLRYFLFLHTLLFVFPEIFVSCSFSIKHFLKVGFVTKNAAGAKGHLRQSEIKEKYEKTDVFLIGLPKLTLCSKIRKRLNNNVVDDRKKKLIAKKLIKKRVFSFKFSFKYLPDGSLNKNKVICIYYR